MWLPGNGELLGIRMYSARRESYPPAFQAFGPRFSTWSKSRHSGQEPPELRPHWAKLFFVPPSLTGMTSFKKRCPLWISSPPPPTFL